MISPGTPASTTGGAPTAGDPGHARAINKRGPEEFEGGAHVTRLKKPITSSERPSSNHADSVSKIRKYGDLPKSQRHITSAGRSAYTRAPRAPCAYVARCDVSIMPRNRIPLPGSSNTIITVIAREEKTII